MNDHQYIESLHIKMHETFKNVINYLEEKNLSWYVCGGTAIGAVRHHDFIPWDDDIDIYMPRQDYNILISLKEDIKQNTNLELLDIDNQGYTQWFAKFVDKDSTTLESFNIPIIYGVWVDIFPIDYVSNNKEDILRLSNTFKSLFLDYQQTVIPFDFKDLFSDLKYLKLHSFISRLVNACSKKRSDTLRNRFKQFESSIQHSTGEYLVSYCENGRVLETEWFVSSEWFRFSDYQVRVPVGYDAYLRSVFGDYMVLPREEDRVTHRMTYVNLKERLTKQEIKNRLRKGESFVEK